MTDSRYEAALAIAIKTLQEAALADDTGSETWYLVRECLRKIRPLVPECFSGEMVP